MSQATAQVLEPAAPDFIPEDELIYDDGVPLDSPWHRQQINLFIAVARQLMVLRGEHDFFAGGDMFVYYSTEQARAIEQEVRQLPLPTFEVFDEELPPKMPEHKNFRGPDVFVVRGDVVERERKVWASWLENGRLPDFVLEVQSTSTAKTDVTVKKKIYAEEMRTPEYFHYGPDDPELGVYQDVLEGHRLTATGLYKPIEADQRGWTWSEVLGGYVGQWDGEYEGTKARWIRLYDAAGRLIPTETELACQQKEAAEERAEEERQQKEDERRQKETAEERAETAEAEVARLRKLLESPDD